MLKYSYRYRRIGIFLERSYYMAVYHCPDINEKDWENKFKVRQGQYLCYNCNKPQKIKELSGYLKPCKYCGCQIFWK
jgi:hypothetical protein